MAPAGPRSNLRWRVARRSTTSARRSRSATGSASRAGCCEAVAEPRRFSPLAWARHHIPTRETIGRYRLLRPFARQLSQPNLWRLNHRSVPRGVAIGLGVGIIIPFMHVVLAALLAIPARANIMLAAAFTLLVNPLTIPPMYYA